MFVDEKHLFRQSPTLTLLFPMTPHGQEQRQTLGFLYQRGLEPQTSAATMVSTLIVMSSKIYFCL